MASGAIAHLASGLMGYWLRGHFRSIIVKYPSFDLFRSISNRLQLAKEMHIERLMKKNKVGSVQWSPLLQSL